MLRALAWRRACAVLDGSPRTWQRGQAEGGVKVDGRHAAAQARTPANALRPAERQHLLGVANSPELAGQPPSQIVPRLANRAAYLASEATFYRVLRAADHQGAQPPPPAGLGRHRSPSGLELGYHLAGLRRGRAVFLP